MARPVSPRPTGKHRRAPTVPTLPRTPQTLTSWGWTWDEAQGLPDTASSGGRGSNTLRPTQLSRPQAEKGHGAQGPRDGRPRLLPPLPSQPPRSLAQPSAQGWGPVSSSRGNPRSRPHPIFPQASEAMLLRKSIRSVPGGLRGVLSTMQGRRIPQAKTFSALLPRMLQPDPSARITVR